MQKNVVYSVTSPVEEFSYLGDQNRETDFSFIEVY